MVGTAADRVREQLMCFPQLSVERKESIFAEFHARLNLSMWRLEKVVVDGDDVVLGVSFYDENSREIRKEEFSYIPSGPGYRRKSDLSIMLDLGVPLTYLEGAWDVAKCIASKRWEYDKERNELKDVKDKAKRSRLKNVKERQRLLDERQNLHSTDGFRDELARELDIVKKQHQEEVDAINERHREEVGRLEEKIEALREDAARTRVHLSSRYGKAEAPKDLNDISRELVSLPFGRSEMRICGVYFLTRNGVVVYVGQSVSVIGRLASHASEGKDFDGVHVLLCGSNDLMRMEREWINKLLPEYNKDSMVKKLRSAKTDKQ